MMDRFESNGVACWRVRTLRLLTVLVATMTLGAGSAAAAVTAGPVGPSPRYKVVAYVTGWSPPVAIDTSRITHVNFAFATIDATGQATVPAGESEARLRDIVALRREHPSLRVLVSIGGWGADGFSDAALDAASRRRFADSAAELVRRYDLDGIDLDWEYPGQGVAGIKARPEDRENFTRLLADVRERLDVESRRARRRPGDQYLLTIATADGEYFEHVEMARLQALVDWINVMAYDFYNSLTRTTGHHAGLYRAESAPAGDRWAAASIEQHLAAGVPARKLVLGVAFYGRRFEGVAPVNGGLNQPYDKYGGDEPYRSLVEQFIDGDSYVQHWDSQSCAPWLWNAATRSFVSYDDPRSIRLKAAYARRLGGVMFWELSQDSADATLLRAITAGLDARDEVLDSIDCAPAGD
jgi:chitinase